MQVLELWAWEFKPWCWIGWNKHNINARDNTYLSTATIVSGNASGLDHQKSSAETQKKIRFWIWQLGHGQQAGMKKQIYGCSATSIWHAG